MRVAGAWAIWNGIQQVTTILMVWPRSGRSSSLTAMMPPSRRLLEQRLHGGTELLLCLEVFLLQQLVATQDVRQIRVEEAELPHQIEDGIQVAHQILQPDLAAADRSETVAQVAGVLIEDGVDDVFFVSEVVVKVAGLMPRCAAMWLVVMLRSP